MRSSLERLVPLALACAVALAGAACGSSSPTSPTTPGPSLAAPGIDSPADGTEVATTRPTLTVLNVFSPPQGTRTYEFQVSTSASFGALIVNQVGVAEGTSKTSFTLTTELAADSRYYWRARAVQGGTAGPWSATPSFRVVKGQSPVIKSVSARGAKPNEPINFADLGETITVTAVADDTDTPADRLVYDWKASAGTLSGTGASVRWQAPTGIATPATATITLTVSDGPVGTSNSTESTLTVNLHDSGREIAEMATQFLTDFSTQIDPVQVVRNFTTACAGRASELEDVRRNQRCFKINGYTLGTPVVTLNFGGVCSFRSRPGDACAAVAASWTSTTLRTDSDCQGGQVGTVSTVSGTDWLTAVYERPRWWLCDSDFEARTGSTARIKR